jgi:outer membrane protein OmpA-like peptidoglycan-associated protein
MSLINSANLDTSSLSNLSSLFSGGGTAASDLLKTGTSRLVPALFGDRSGALVNALSSTSGIKTSSATNMIALVVPIVLTFLKKMIGDRGLNASSLSSLLTSQTPNLQGALDSRITNALGFASPSSFVNSIGGAAGAAADTARRATATVASGVASAGSAAYSAGSAAVAEGASAMSRLLPWIIAAIVLFLLWLLFWPKGTAPTPPTATPTANAPATTPPVAMAPAAVVFVGFPAKVYFDSGSASVGDDGGKVVSAAADAIKKDNLKVAVTGYTDKTGDTAKNEELAKNRAGAVRDALTAAGVPAANIEMKPPMFVEVGGTITDAEARRVEINKN